ncbi:MAG: putative zinc-binding protein [Solirubrobacterales bacterium]
MSNQCGNSGCGTSAERICPEGYRYVKQVLEQSPKVAVMACEGACIKGEVARVAANMLAYQMHREDAVRVCLGDAATGNSGFLELVQKAPRVISIEGCSLRCGTEILQNRIKNLEATVINASDFYEYDKSRHFEIFDLPHSTIEDFSRKVADHVSKALFTEQKPAQDQNDCGCCCGCC